MAFISIHAPREGGDPRKLNTNAGCSRYFNPRPPRGGRPRSAPSIIRSHNFNPRPPRGGRLFTKFRTDVLAGTFQSTPPARGATRQWSESSGGGDISIHAPREGGDLASLVLYQRCWISIHAPREGGDLAEIITAMGDSDFNPRPPRGGRRYRRNLPPAYANFNPRPPRGGRRMLSCLITISCIFQSTPPARGATV